MGPVRDLPIAGGHLALDFLNTVDAPKGSPPYDHLGTYPQLLHWAARLAGLPADHAQRLHTAGQAQPAAAVAALARAHALRDTLTAIFTGITTGGTANATEHWADLQPYTVDALGHAQLTELTGEPPRYRLTWPAEDDLDAPLWPVAHAALDLLTTPDLRRLKRCAGCPWLFLDRSKNGSRRWCAMDDCGTDAKIRTYVARRAAAGRRNDRT
jgi:predicted RNA-binding Zn ribbon-like protein